MTTKELIQQLQELDPSGESTIEVPVKTYTAAYPHAYLEPDSLEQSPWPNRVRLCVSFPEGFIVSKRKGVAA